MCLLLKINDLQFYSTHMIYCDFWSCYLCFIAYMVHGIILQWSIFPRYSFSAGRWLHEILGSWGMHLNYASYWSWVHIGWLWQILLPDWSFWITWHYQIDNENEIDAIRPLPWYPGKLAWHSNFSRMQLRKNQTLERWSLFLHSSTCIQPYMLWRTLWKFYSIFLSFIIINCF